MPISVENIPPVQRVHVVEPILLETKLLLHCTQVLFDIIPVDTLNVPSVHFVQTLFPNPVSNVPDGQLIQETL